MAFLTESGVVVALDGNGVVFRPKNGAKLHTTDRPTPDDLQTRIEQAREGITPGSLTVADLEERMRWALQIQPRRFRDNWRIYSKEDLDKPQDAPSPRVPIFGVDVKLGQWAVNHLMSKFFKNFELDPARAVAIKRMAEAGYPPSLLTGIKQFGRWGIREMLDEVWQYLHKEAAVVLTSNHDHTGADIKETFFGVASAAYPVLGEDDDPYPLARLERYAERLWCPNSLEEVTAIADKSYPGFNNFHYSKLRAKDSEGKEKVIFNAGGGDILAYLCNRN